jgi:putative transcriptional regulator
MKITNKIKVLRAMNNMSQEDLAKKSGVTRQTINAIENNKYVPSLSLAFMIAEVFGVSVTKVFKKI